jgi:hypothetical protein
MVADMFWHWQISPRGLFSDVLAMFKCVRLEIQNFDALSRRRYQK